MTCFCEHPQEAVKETAKALKALAELSAQVHWFPSNVDCEWAFPGIAGLCCRSQPIHGDSKVWQTPAQSFNVQQVWAEGIRDNLQKEGAAAPPPAANGCVPYGRNRRSGMHSRHLGLLLLERSLVGCRLSQQDMPFGIRV